MPSPFPGMDPYLEQHWRDVHHRLCTYACDALQPQVRLNLVARIEERLVVESDPGDDRSIYPDVKVVQRRPVGTQSVEQSGVIVADEPLVVLVEDEKPTEGFIQIIDPGTGGKLVTVIEFLSTSKLPGEGQRQYRQKQRELRDAGVSLVEIDLLRSGDWILQLPRFRIEPADQTPYRVCAHRGWEAGRYEFYRIPIARRLPIIRIPLRPQDADARLDLQALIDQTYVNGAYDMLNYTRPPIPPLDQETASWADGVVSEAHKRPD